MKTKSSPAKRGRKQDFPASNTAKQNFERAQFGSNSANPNMQRASSFVALWPSEKDLTDRLGNYAQIVRWTAKRNGRQQRFVEARFSPAIQALLDILVPALCNGDSKPFSAFAEAIEQTTASDRVAKHALALASELTGRALPFNSTFEPLPDFYSDLHEPDDAKPLPDVGEGFTVPMIRSEERRVVKKRSGKENYDASNFLRICRNLKITFAKDPRNGGRKPHSSVL